MQQDWVDGLSRAYRCVVMMDPGDSSAGKGFQGRLAVGHAVLDWRGFDAQGSDSAHGQVRKETAADRFMEIMD